MGEKFFVAFTWNDIDWDEHTVRIHRAFKAANRSIGPPKSKAGNRTLPLSDSLYKKLKEWKTVVEKELGETEYICCNTLGNLLYTESLYDWWIAFLKRNDISKIDLHELRHTNLTLIARHTSAFDLKNWAGWSSLDPALRYVHGNPKMLKKAVVNAGL